MVQQIEVLRVPAPLIVRKKVVMVHGFFHAFLVI